MLDRVAGTSPNARLLAGDLQAGRTIWGRIVNALSASLLAHVAGFLLIAFIITRLPDGTPPAKITSEAPSDITWIARAETGGGGSENDTPKPARTTELPSYNALTVPLSKPHKSDPELTTDPPKPEPQIQIPAVMTTAGIQDISALTSLSITGSQEPGTGGRGGDGKGSGVGPGTGPGLGPGRNGGTGDGYRGSNGVASPRLIKEVKPGYTPQAMRARIQGMVTLQAVVLPDGSVGTAHIVRSLDSTFGLDEEAVKAVKLWRFLPGTLAGRAVPVMIEIELTFTLR